MEWTAWGGDSVLASGWIAVTKGRKQNSETELEPKPLCLLERRKRKWWGREVQGEWSVVSVWVLAEREYIERENKRGSHISLSSIFFPVCKFTYACFTYVIFFLYVICG